MRVKVIHKRRVEDKIQDGRDAWITRNSDGLCIGRIYDGENDAADLTTGELFYLEEVSKGTGAFQIVDIISNLQA